jgi:predicted dehydrogenase
VATPVGSHREAVLAAAAAGKHVLCEKPFGLDVAEAEEMAAACRRAGVRLGAGFMMRYHAQHRAALALIRENRIGRPVYGRAQLSCWYPLSPGAWRQDPEKGGGGSLVDMGSHCIDLLEMLLGPARRVSCFLARAVHGYPVEDGATALLEFAGGAIGTVDSFFSIPDAASANVLEVYGSGGSIIARGTIGQGSRGEMRLVASSADAAYAARQDRGSTEGIAVDPEPVNPYRAEIEEFGRAVLEGREPPVGTAEGLRSQEVLAACYESARRGAAVEI